MALEPGDVIGHYEMVAPLGAGGMGEVFLANDRRLDRQVAIKVIASSVADQPDRLRRFIREARTASSLNHSHIAHVYEIGEADGVHFIAMEYVRGESLARTDRRQTDAALRCHCLRHADRRRPRRGTQFGRHPPGSQAGQRDHLAARPAEDSRFRSGQGRQRGSRSDLGNTTLAGERV